MSKYDGRSCAVGCLMPPGEAEARRYDEGAGKGLKYVRITSLLPEFRAGFDSHIDVDRISESDELMEALGALQTAHDYAFVWGDMPARLLHAAIAIGVDPGILVTWIDF